MIIYFTILFHKTVSLFILYQSTAHQVHDLTAKIPIKARIPKQLAEHHSRIPLGCWDSPPSTPLAVVPGRGPASPVPSSSFQERWWQDMLGSLVLVEKGWYFALEKKEISVVTGYPSGSQTGTALMLFSARVWFMISPWQHKLFHGFLPISVLVCAMGRCLAKYLISAGSDWSSEEAVVRSHASTEQMLWDLIDLQQFTVRGQDIICFSFPALRP